MTQHVRRFETHVDPTCETKDQASEATSQGRDPIANVDRDRSLRTATKRRRITRQLIVFNNVSLDGYFVDSNGDMSWAHKQDDEWKAFVEENASGNGEFVFGRITYEMMASFWPTPQAKQNMPVVAEKMNQSPKVVFSKSLEKVAWNNSRVITGDLVTEVRRLKNESGPEMVILGSGSIVAQLAQEGLIDEFQLVVIPVVLGTGRTLFDGIKVKQTLKHTRTRTFINGNVLLCYSPIA